jgi:hypothetical protein
LEETDCEDEARRQGRPQDVAGGTGRDGLRGTTALDGALFGYPDFLSTSATELIDAQYADRTALRPVYEAIVKAAAEIGEIVTQARKGYVSLLTPRRTFARLQATTRSRERIDVGLRLEKEKPQGRLTPCRIHQTMPLQFSLSTLKEFDPEARQWLGRAYDENT